VLERIAAFAARYGVAAREPVAGVGFGSRHRARLMVRGRTRTPKLGIFQEGTHRIVDIPACRIHHPAINRVAATVREVARDLGVESYADGPHRGDLRALQVVVQSRTGRAQCVLVENAATPGPVAALEAPLRAALGDDLHSLWWNGNPERTNAILGPHWLRLHGPDVVWETTGGCEIAYPPGAFGQSQPDLADAIARRVHASVPDGARVLELYAGCGPLGMGLLRNAERVVFNEVNEASLAGLERSLARRPAGERDRAVICPGPAETHLSVLGDVDVVVLDPPRKGLAAAVLDALCTRPPQQLVWVSCGLDAFLAQAEVLLARTPLRLRDLSTYALFPFTEHVETLAVFER
jgi:23S rRNA (uracil1939-C5)-methyltransferase